MQGRLFDAVRVNPVGVIVVLALISFGVRSLAEVVRRRPMKRPTIALPSTRIGQAALAIVVGVCWFVRLHAPDNLVGG